VAGEEPLACQRDCCVHVLGSKGPTRWQGWLVTRAAAVQGKPTECDQHNADVAIVHVLQGASPGTPEEQLLDEFAAYFSSRFPTDNVGDVRAFVAGVYLDLKEEDQVCEEPKRSSGRKGKSTRGRKSKGKRGSKSKKGGKKSRSASKKRSKGRKGSKSGRKGKGKKGRK